MSENSTQTVNGKQVPLDWVHVTPVKLLIMVWGSLVALTVVTVLVSNMDLGAFDLWAAMIIASLKASVVALYFMHMRWSHPMIAVIFIGALVFVAIFIGGVLLDTLQYAPEMVEGYAPALGQ